MLFVEKPLALRGSANEYIDYVKLKVGWNLKIAYIYPVLLVLFQDVYECKFYHSQQIVQKNINLNSKQSVIKK